MIYFSKYYFPCSRVSCVLVQTSHSHHTESHGQHRGNHKKIQMLLVQINVLPELLHCIIQGIRHFLVYSYEEICLRLNFQMTSNLQTKSLHTQLFAKTVFTKPYQCGKLAPICMCKNNVYTNQTSSLPRVVFLILLGLLRFTMWVCMTALGSQAYSHKVTCFSRLKF